MLKLLQCLWVCVCTIASFNVNFSVDAPCTTFKRIIAMLPCFKNFARKNSFSQRSPAEHSGDVLELNNSCAHLCGSMSSNLQPLTKARPSLGFVGPYDLWLTLYILMALEYLSYYNNLGKGENCRMHSDKERSLYHIKPQASDWTWMFE